MEEQSFGTAKRTQDKLSALERECQHLAREECANNDGSGYCMPRDILCKAFINGGVCVYFAAAVAPRDEKINKVLNGPGTCLHMKKRIGAREW